MTMELFLKQCQQYFVPYTSDADVHKLSRSVKAHYPKLQQLLEEIGFQQREETIPDVEYIISTNADALSAFRKCVDHIDSETGCNPRQMLILAFSLATSDCFTDPEKDENIQNIIHSLADNHTQKGGCVPGIINRLYTRNIFVNAIAYLEDRVHIEKQITSLSDHSLFAQAAPNVPDAGMGFDLVGQDDPEMMAALEQSLFEF